MEKIQKLLQVGTDAVRICFDKYFPQEELGKTLKENETDMRRGQFRFLPPQLQILFPPQDGSNTGVSSLSMDIAIMYKLLRNFSDIPPPGKGWGKKPEVDYITESDDIERIRLYRNKYSMHNYDAPSGHGISDDVFNVIWTDLSKAIMRLSNGVLRRRINEISESEPTVSPHEQVLIEESKSKSAIASTEIHESLGYKLTEGILRLLLVGMDAVRICFDKYFPKEDLDKILEENETDMRRGMYRFQPLQLEILFPRQEYVHAPSVKICS